MRVIAPGLRPAFGLFLIAHGLTHAVLPLRGWMDPARLAVDFMPLILYSVAVLGFMMAGLGVFGVRPFSAVIRPALVLASAYSLIAIWRMGQGDLWWGAGVDLALFLTGVTGVYRYLPRRREPLTGYRHRVAVTAGMALVVYAGAAVLLWPLHRAWGSERAEHALALPGDRPDRNPALELQHAVTVNAAPEQVWMWLVQLGQEPGRTVNAVTPGRAMVLQNRGALVLEPTADGKTRFIIRTPVGRENTPVWTAALDMVAFELPHFIMERRMMLRIKSLAEAGSLPL